MAIVDGGKRRLILKIMVCFQQIRLIYPKQSLPEIIPLLCMHRTRQRGLWTRQSLCRVLTHGKGYTAYLPTRKDSLPCVFRRGHVKGLCRVYFCGAWQRKVINGSNAPTALTVLPWTTRRHTAKFKNFTVYHVFSNKEKKNYFVVRLTV
jgi:hypothetical protein